jgi:sterol desaturase/sphingolipid hydroxylase (fatty acid hydroxylase superfamily)
MVAWKWFFPRFRASFLYAEKPASKHLKRELKYSILTTLIFMLPTLTVIGTNRLGWSQMYMQIADRGMAWYLMSFVLVFFLHDTYFYWTHRLMHTRKLYPLFHKTHHLSLEPSPLAAFAFHPLEAIVESGIFILLPLLVPVHWSVLVLFTLFSLFMNVYGHLGFNVFSPAKLRKFPLNLLSHSTHHSWHHRFQRGNYGFYLQMWDRVMGTWQGELPPPVNKDQHSHV